MSAQVEHSLPPPPCRAVTIVHRERGRPNTARAHFSRVFPTDLQFRDLRRTAISEVLSKGGRAEPISVEPISGHAPGSMATRVYEVPDKEASRTVMALRSGKPETPPRNKPGR